MTKVTLLFLLIMFIVLLGGCQKEDRDLPPFETIAFFSPQFIGEYQPLGPWVGPSLPNSFHELIHNECEYFEPHFWSWFDADIQIEEGFFDENLLLFVVVAYTHIEYDLRWINLVWCDWRPGRLLIEVISYFDFNCEESIMSGEMKTFGFFVRVCREFWGEPTSVTIGLLPKAGIL